MYMLTSGIFYFNWFTSIVCCLNLHLAKLAIHMYILPEAKWCLAERYESHVVSVQRESPAVWKENSSITTGHISSS